MANYILPFKDKYQKKQISNTAATLAIFVSVVLIVLSNEFYTNFLTNILAIVVIYVVMFIFLEFLGGSFRKGIKVLLAAGIIIFFLGLPSLFFINGYQKASLIWTRGILSASLLILYSSTITMQEFIQSLRSLFIPNIIVTIILLILRYSPLLFEEGKEIRISQDLRGYQFATRKEKIKSAGALLGGTFIRSVRKGGEIYEAMLLRGMEGSQLTSREKLRWVDPFVLIVLTVVLSLLSGGILECIMR